MYIYIHTYTERKGREERQKRGKQREPSLSRQEPVGATYRPRELLLVVRASPALRTEDIDSFKDVTSSWLHCL